MPRGSAINVRPDTRGQWVVRDEDDPRFTSEHETATEAEFAARSRARASGVDSIMVRDRYERVRESAVRADRPRQSL
jgi:hypothetical protein